MRTAVLILATLLTGWNWYLQPERAPAWVATIFLLAGMAVALYLASNRSGLAVRRGAAESIGDGIVFAGVILVSSLAAKLATSLSGIDTGDLSQRTTMAVLGVMFAFMGNGLPKRLTPLSALQCDPAKAQAFQRFAAWTWVLTGLAFAIAWVVMPVGIAKPASLGLIVGGTLLILAQAVRLHRARRAA